MLKPTVVFALFTVVALLLAQSAQAAIVEVEVTIKSIDVKARGITVVYETNLGQKTIDLDVSRKAEITVNGKEGTLGSLGEGLKAKVSYDKELAVVTKLEATGVVVKRKAPELVEVSELNPGISPCFTNDGLTVCWERTGVLWTAHRPDAESYFADKKELFAGRHPTMTSDGLEMIFLSMGDKGEGLCVAKRESTQQSFKRAVAIPELADQPQPKNPSLTPNGLNLYFNRSGNEIVVCVRETKDAPWSKPKPVPVAGKVSGFLDWPYVGDDGLTMYCCNEGAGQLSRSVGNLMVWFRTSATEPFATQKAIEPKGLPTLIGRSPRYVAATHELFFTRAVVENGKPHWSGIWVIRNFVPPEK